MYESQVIAELSGYDNIGKIVQAVIAIWPEHERYCRARFGGNDTGFLARMDTVAGLIKKIADRELDRYCADYRWMCEEFLREELYFRRHGAYRLATFADAYREVYGRDEYMSRYVRGILISQLLWTPHARAFDCFRTTFLESLPARSAYLEVGPGHGLFLYFASKIANVSTLEAWDVSAASIAETKAVLRSLGVTRTIELREQDVLKAPPNPDKFDAAVISEVLEHLERPDVALGTLRQAMRPGGRIFINAPLNSPAPDHIFLWRTPEEIREFVQNQGFEIELFELFPVTGSTLKFALRQNLSVSCVVIGRKPS